ncbi:MAG: hypothetical protein ACK5ML_04320 [Lachnospiraceae bacterium]
MQYRNKHPSDAFVFNRDSEVTGPEWFVRAVNADQITIDRAIHDGASRVYGCTIQTRYGNVRAKCGHYIVPLADGVIIPLNKTEFNDTFERKVNKRECKSHKKIFR